MYVTRCISRQSVRKLFLGAEGALDGRSTKSQNCIGDFNLDLENDVKVARSRNYKMLLQVAAISPAILNAESKYWVL